MNERKTFGLPRYRTRLKCYLGRPDCVGEVTLFFLLIFFLLMATSLVRFSGIQINLPEIKAPLVTGLGKLIVTVTPPPEPGKPGKIYFKDRELSLESLRQELLQIGDRKNQTLIIRADRDVPTAVLYQILAEAEAAQMKCFLVGQTPEDNPEMKIE